MDCVAVISHDAGGAEILSSWVKRHPQFNIVISAEGPALSVFRRKCPSADFVTVKQAIAKATLILCGTGWQTDFEKQAIHLGKLAGKKTVAFLDHWVNYRERFIFNGQSQLPDEIWVGDEEAFVIACQMFPETDVIKLDNPYVDELRGQIAAYNSIKKEANHQNGSAPNILYICEPVTDHARLQYGDERYFGYTEQEALQYFLEHVGYLSSSIASIKIRPHPSEVADKYLWVRDIMPDVIQFSAGESLLSEVLAADIVVGCESMAMVVGMLADKRVISTIPPSGRSCQLPHSVIEHLSILVAKGLQDG